MGKILKSGASVPMKDRPDILAALNKVADSQGVDPAAIASIIHTESVWDSRNVTGSFVGLTQVGPEFLTKTLKVTKKEFLNLSSAEQIAAYDKWLDSFQFKKKMKDNGIKVLAMPLARQAALLQGMQFSPNGKAWKTALAKGDLTVPTTPSPQAKVLGDTSIGDMEDYYTGFFKKRPPVYA